MAPLFAAIDLGGSHIAVALGDGSGRVHAERRVPIASNEGPEAILNMMGTVAMALARETGADLQSAGVGVPGLVDIGSGVAKFLPNLPTQWRDVPIRGRLEKHLHCPVYVLNDSRVATLGELEFGLGRGVNTMIFYTLGTGVGGGVVVDGRLRLGPTGSAGEIGHVQVDPNGGPCTCGSRGCLETLASGTALTAEGVRLAGSGHAPRLLELAGGDLARITPALLGEAARAGEQTARRAIERAGECLGAAAATLVTALNPDLIVLAGGVAGLSDLLIPPMRRVIAERVHMFPVDSLRIERSVLGDRAGVLGALVLAMRGGQLLAPSRS